MSEKVLGFKEKDGYRNSHFTGRMSEHFWKIKESDCVPVRLKSESVGLKWLEDLIKKEWKEHKENWDESGEWFECSDVENDVYNNYAVGASITTTCSNGLEKIIILKTKKEADEYTRKMKEKYAGCCVCNRFRTLLCAVRAKAKGV